MKQAKHFLLNIDSKVLVFSLVAIAIALRLPYVFDDFWLDEIWSLNLAKSVDSISAAVTELKFDANHILNTVQFYLVGASDSWINYRIVSFISGIASLFLIYRVALIFGRRQAIIATLLSSVCFPLVLYASEARGYAMSIMFSLIAFLSLHSYLVRGKTIFAALFWVSCILAMLSHFSFAYIYAAYLQWSVYFLWKNRQSKQQFLWLCSKLQIVPLIVFAFLYFSFIQKMGVAGANVSTWRHEISKFVALVYGLPKIPILTLPYLCFTLFAITWVSCSLYKKQSDYWPLFGLLIVVNPVLVILIADYGYPQMRYFLLLLPFLLIVLSIFLVAMYRKTRQGRIFYCVFLATYLLGSLILDFSFIRHGRGEYLAAMQYLVENTPSESISVGSDHDYRNFALLEFYSQYLPGNKSIRYIAQQRLKDNPPNWYIAHDLVKSAKVKDTIVVADRNYQLVASYLAYDPEIIGWHWHIYKIAN